jgi:hypothetical protein
MVSDPEPASSILRDPLVAFTESGFRMLLRNEFGGRVPSGAPGAPDPEVGTLDEAPDRADCWVFGLYWRVLGRLPTPEDLKADGESIRSGGRTPEELLIHLCTTEECIRRGAPDSSSPETIFVTGCYVAILGRVPDEAGLNAFAANLLAGGSEQAVIDTISTSPEALRSPRFPPADRFDFESALGEALQEVVLGTKPDPVLTAELAGRIRSDTSIATLVRELLLRDTRKRAAIRASFISRQLTAAVLVEARLRRLQHNAESQQAWAWRVDRRTWAMIDELRKQGRQLEAKVATLRAGSVDDATVQASIVRM